MTFLTIDSPVFRSPSSAVDATRGGHCLPPARASLIPHLPGYFITKEGEVETRFRSDSEAHDEDGVAGLLRNPRPGTSPNELSEREALNRLARVLSESGQLVVRSADGLMTAWFAGIGDPENLFLELRPREAWVDRDELVMGTLCPLSEAERVLRSLYRGAGANELSVAIGGHHVGRI